MECLKCLILACLCFTSFCYTLVPFSTADVHFPSSWLPDLFLSTKLLCSSLLFFAKFWRLGIKSSNTHLNVHIHFFSLSFMCHLGYLSLTLSPYFWWTATDPVLTLGASSLGQGIKTELKTIFWYIQRFLLSLSTCSINQNNLSQLWKHSGKERAYIHYGFAVSENFAFHVLHAVSKHSMRITAAVKSRVLS